MEATQRNEPGRRETDYTRAKEQFQALNERLDQASVLFMEINREWLKSLPKELKFPEAFETMPVGAPENDSRIVAVVDDLVAAHRAGFFLVHQEREATSRLLSANHLADSVRLEHHRQGGVGNLGGYNLVEEPARPVTPDVQHMPRTYARSQILAIAEARLEALG